MAQTTFNQPLGPLCCTVVFHLKVPVRTMWMSRWGQVCCLCTCMGVDYKQEYFQVRLQRYRSVDSWLKVIQQMLLSVYWQAVNISNILFSSSFCCRNQLEFLTSAPKWFRFCTCTAGLWWEYLPLVKRLFLIDRINAGSQSDPLPLILIQSLLLWTFSPPFSTQHMTR